MIRRALAFTLLLLTVLLLQTVVAPGVRIAGVAPDLVALSVLAVGMAAGSAPGVRYGFAAGLAVDLLAGTEQILGVSTLLLLLAGYVAGLARPFIAASRMIGQLLVGGAGVLALVVAEELFAVLLGRPAAPLGSFFGEALVAGLYGAALAPVLCALVDWLDRLLPAPG